MANEQTAQEVEEVIVGSDESDGSDGKQRERSSVQFPYQDLSEAVAIAKGVHEFGGTTAQLSQLAAQVNQSPNSSMFKLRVSTARMFGFVSNSQGNVTLTALGVRVCDPLQENAARVEAFLNIPLYKQVFEKFRSATLPPNNGLENEMVSMGVAAKQKSNARQVFQRYANQAGFFGFGPNRLVQPAIRGGVPPPPGDAGSEGDPGTIKKKKGDGGGDEGGGGELHPLIAGLIASLPKNHDENWAIEKRVKWLRAASQNFDLIYPDTGDDSIEIKIQRGRAQ